MRPLHMVLLQAGILSGEGGQDLLLLDVTPLTLGIETVGGVLTKLIPRNTVVPTRKSQVFEGERAMTKDCHLLGKFELGGITPAPRGVPQIEVSFEINADGILHVSANDKANGNSKSISITNEKGRLSPEEIERMLQEAEEFAEADQKERERVDARNSFEAYVFQTKSALRGDEGSTSNVADKLSEDEKETIDKALEEANEWLDDNQSAEKEALDEKLSDLKAAVGPILGLAYERSGIHDPGGAGGADDDLDAHDEL